MVKSSKQLWLHRFHLKNCFSNLTDSFGNYYFNASQKGLNSYSWKFGDSGSSNAGDSVGHNYKDSGIYSVSLCVIGAGGCSACSTQSVHVYRVNSISEKQVNLFG